MLNCFQQNELKGERGDSGVKGEKGEPGGGYYDPRFGGVQGQPGPPGKPGLPVSSESKFIINGPVAYFGIWYFGILSEDFCFYL